MKEFDIMCVCMAQAVYLTPWRHNIGIQMNHKELAKTLEKCFFFVYIKMCQPRKD